MRWKTVQTKNRNFNGSSEDPITYEATIHLEGDAPGSGVTLKDLQDFLVSVIASGVPNTAKLGTSFDMSLRWQ